MENTLFKSEDEIEKVFSEHYESLKLSGLPFNVDEIFIAWDEAVQEFRSRNSTD
jgi:hypothetical protein